MMIAFGCDSKEPLSAIDLPKYLLAIRQIPNEGQTTKPAGNTKARHICMIIWDGRATELGTSSHFPAQELIEVFRVASKRESSSKDELLSPDRFSISISLEKRTNMGSCCTS